MKTNAEQTPGFRLLHELTANRGTGASSRKNRNEIASAKRASMAKPWWAALATILHRAYSSLNERLTEVYRLCGQSAPAGTQDESGLVSLRQAEICNLTKGRGASRMEVYSGIVWLTGDPADGDVLLRAGDSFELKGSWVYVAQAMDDGTTIFWS